MPTFSFTITGAERDALLSTTGSTDTEVVIDKSSRRTVNQQILNANFGDGYEQRARNGINTKREEWSVNFANRPAAEINLIAAYLDSKTAASFTLTITEATGNTAMKVVCDTYNIAYIHENYHSLSATFRRVYEP